MHDNNKHKIKAKIKLTKSRLLKFEFRKLVEIGHHGKT